MNNLVIVESPTKAHTVGRILGPGYKVMASVGHVRDLPEHTVGVRPNPEETAFTPVYVVPDAKKKVVDSLVKAARSADCIYLASDPDREGEAIAWHLREILEEALGRGAKPIRRVEYHEITPAAVREAFRNPHDVNMLRVDSQQARRVIDRWLGFKISPKVAKAVRGGSSAGRVQSVALRLVCEREAAIRDFKPVPYWEFPATVRKTEGGRDAFTVRLRKLDGAKPEVHEEAAAEAVRSFLDGASWSVREVSPQDRKRRPGPPFTTSTLQQSASNSLGFSPDTTMRLAQALYEQGLITYMRTDSVSISEEARAAAARYVEGTWGREFSDPHNYANNRKGVQAAHECIRPTDPAEPPAAVEARIAALEGIRDADAAARLYRLIWNRFTTSQMAPAVYRVVAVRVAAVSGAREAELTASTSSLTFPGYLMALGEDARKRASTLERAEKDEEGGDGEESDELARLPELAAGERLELVAVSPDRRETKPPPRFNEASLVKELETNGIGRPSTYAAVVKTLKDRKYVRSERRILTPTELGRAVSDYLVPRFPEMMDVAFTARMEEQLDEVEDPDTKLDWQGLLRAFHSQLKGWLPDPSVDLSRVRPLLAAFRSVRRWAKPRKVGKRTYDDRQFVQDIANDFAGVPRAGRKADDDAEAPAYAFDPSVPAAPAARVNANQLAALGKILAKYRDQVPEAEDALRAAGLPDLLDEPAAQPPDDGTRRIVELLEKHGVEPQDERFFRSLAEQVADGKNLSSKQRFYLGRVFLGARERIPGFSPELCGELGIEWKDETPTDPEEAEELLSALGRVTAWNEPSRRGRKSYDDRDFYASVAAQFGSRKRLSERQVRALGRMLLRYRDQIPDADAILAKYGIKPSPRAAKRTSSNA